VDFVLVDSARGAYAGGLDLARIRRHGVEVTDADLITSESAFALDPRWLVEALLSLV